MRRSADLEGFHLMKRILTIATLIVLVSSLSACGGSPSLVGPWMADEGSGIKVVDSGGRCSGMYYNHGEPLDIGGGMRCSMGSKKDSHGRVSLVVSQPPNQE